MEISQHLYVFSGQSMWGQTWKPPCGTSKWNTWTLTSSTGPWPCPAQAGHMRVLYLQFTCNSKRVWSDVSKCRWFGVHSMNKTGDGRKMFLTRDSATSWVNSSGSFIRTYSAKPAQLSRDSYNTGPPGIHRMDTFWTVDTVPPYKDWRSCPATPVSEVCWLLRFV